VAASEDTAVSACRMLIGAGMTAGGVVNLGSPPRWLPPLYAAECPACLRGRPAWGSEPAPANAGRGPAYPASPGRPEGPARGEAFDAPELDPTEAAILAALARGQDYTGGGRLVGLSVAAVKRRVGSFLQSV